VVVLALDDVHTLERRPAAVALGLLVSDLPPTAHLALASRSALHLPLGRFRAGAVELGEEALAFTEAESAEVLRAARLALSPKAVEDLHRATEGWAAGLILAAQSGGTLLDPTRLASGGPSFDYLAEEVFLRQHRDTQDFLLETALLDRFTPDLAAAGWRADPHDRQPTVRLARDNASARRDQCPRFGPVGQPSAVARQQPAVALDHP